mmetsp:Transcript_26850/g.51143  ORF Transcript_26850/g.51143 Transcript_26850/m.51143 type:complete len:139 (+) Transcript_26850:173-589(+)
MAEELGANTAVGSDLLGDNHVHQLEGLRMQASVNANVSALTSATFTCTELFNMVGQVGAAGGALADILIFNRNPLGDFNFTEDSAAFWMIMKEGKLSCRVFFIKNIWEILPAPTLFIYATTPPLPLTCLRIGLLVTLM